MVRVVCAGGAVLDTMRRVTKMCRAKGTVDHASIPLRSLTISDIDVYIMIDPHTCPMRLRQHAWVSAVAYLIPLITCTAQQFPYDWQPVILKTGQAVTLMYATELARQQTPPVIQFSTRIYSDVEQLLTSFDMDASMFAYDGQSWRCTRNAMWSLLAGVVYINPLQASTSWRAYKYAMDKGFTVICCTGRAVRDELTRMERATYLQHLRFKNSMRQSWNVASLAAAALPPPVRLLSSEVNEECLWESECICMFWQSDDDDVDTVVQEVQGHMLNLGKGVASPVECAILLSQSAHLPTDRVGDLFMKVLHSGAAISCHGRMGDQENGLAMLMRMVDSPATKAAGINVLSPCMRNLSSECDTFFRLTVTCAGRQNTLVGDDA
jgi:hypothetical protein